MTENHTIKSPSAAAEPSWFCPPQLIAGEDPVAFAGDPTGQDNCR
jgi:hypothetical protein